MDIISGEFATSLQFINFPAWGGVFVLLVYLLFVSLRQASSPGQVGLQFKVGLFLHGTAVQSTVVSCVFLRNSVFVQYTVHSAVK